MANEIVTEIILNLDKFREQLRKAQGDGEKTGKSIGDSFGGEIEKRLPSALKNLSVAAVAVGGTIAAAMGAIKAIQTAEEIKQVTQQFDVLTARAGIAGEGLSAALMKASAGLADNTDLMKSANRALVELQVGFNKLPQIMEIARQATSVFGGDLIQNFEAINHSIASGNMRALKNLGIIVDQNQAYKDFSKTLGVSANALSEAGKQQALMNAVLEKSKSSFGGIDPNIKQTGDAFTRLKVGLNDLWETVASIFESKFGSMIASALSIAAKAINDTAGVLKANFGSASEQATEKLKGLNDQLGFHQRSLDAAIQSQQKYGGTSYASTIEFQKKKVEELTAQIGALSATVKESAAASSGGPSGGGAVLIDLDKARKEKAEYISELASLTASRVQAEAQLAVSTDEIEASNRANKLLIEETYQAQLSALQYKYLTERHMSAEQFSALETQLNARKNAQIVAADTLRVQTGKQLSQAFHDGVTNAVVAGVKTIGNALVHGGKSFDSFAKAVLGVIGNLAIQLGTVFISAGVGILALKGLGGAAAIAAGVGLVAIGSVISALAGGGGEGDTGGGVAAGAGAGGLNASASAATDFSQVEEKKPQTNVQVVVQGNILDRRETGLHIAEVLNETFGSNGVMIASGA